MMPIAFAADASSDESNVHTAVVFDVDLDAGPLDDAADHLAAGPDDVFAGSCPPGSGS